MGKRTRDRVIRFESLTGKQLADLASDIDDRIGDMLIDEEQINEEAGYDKIAAWRGLSDYLRSESGARP